MQLSKILSPEHIALLRKVRQGGYRQGRYVDMYWLEVEGNDVPLPPITDFMLKRLDEWKLLDGVLDGAYAECFKLCLSETADQVLSEVDNA